MPKYGIAIRVEVDDKEFKKYMSQAIRRGKNLKPPLKRCGMVMLRSFSDNFKRGGRPKRWKRLTPNTIAGRRKQSKKVLQDTGKLRMSTLSKVAPGNIHRQGENSLVMGSNLKIAQYHQWGTKPYTIVPKNRKVLRFMTATGPAFARKVNHPGLPARPFIMIQDEDVKAFVGIFRDYVVGT